MESTTSQRTRKLTWTGYFQDTLRHQSLFFLHRYFFQLWELKSTNLVTHLLGKLHPGLLCQIPALRFILRQDFTQLPRLALNLLYNQINPCDPPASVSIVTQMSNLVQPGQPIIICCWRGKDHLESQVAFGMPSVPLAFRTLDI